MTYSEEIASLVDTHITNRDPLSYSAALLAALGCCHLAENDTGDWVVCTPNQPSITDECVVESALLQALAAHMRLIDSGARTGTIEDEGYSIFHGLSKNNRWRSCLSDQSLARDLVSVMLLGQEDGETSMVGQLRRELRPCAVDVLNEWISPAEAYTEMPSVRVLATALFNEAWCALALDNDALGQDELIEVIRKERPPFKPGLITAALEDAVLLPSLEMIS
jgi:hypothetical protein